MKAAMMMVMMMNNAVLSHPCAAPDLKGVVGRTE